MDPDKWESFDPNDSSGVMISNLPLLFVNGKPTALQLMSVEDFEKFIPFMVRCSTGEAATVPWSELPKPPWWPARLPFRIPSANSSCNKTIMVRIVERCYSYHGCPYLLQFCSSLVDIMPSCGYRFTDNRDGTSSMYHGTTGKLLVTFKNENRDYDRIPAPGTPLQKKLISSMHQGKEKKMNFMVKPPISDVYLCDKCDDEFMSLKEVQSHEKQCEGSSSLTMSLPSPEPELIEDIIDPEEQVPFLSQLGLQPAKYSGIEPYVSPQKKQRLPLKTISFNQFHFDSVDISSPFGRQILSRLRNYGKVEMSQHCVMKYERYIYAPLEDYASSKRRHSNRWPVAFKRKRKYRGWNHLLCFTQEQKDERRRTIATGLNYRSRRLLPKCRRLIIKVKRLQQTEIDKWTRLIVQISFPLIDISGPPSEPEVEKPVAKVISNGDVIKMPIKDPLALPSTSSNTNVICQRILNCRTVTVTRLVRPFSQEPPSKDLKAVNGDVISKKSSSYKKASIEVIDLLSDDESSNPAKSPANGDHSLVNGTISKNGHSHWSPRNSLELGRSSENLANGSDTNLISPKIDNVPSPEDSRHTTDVEDLKSNTVNMAYGSSTDVSSNNIDGKLMKRIRRKEVLRLKSDECRELKKKGLNLLHDFNGGSKKILTRRLAKNRLPTLTTRNSQFVIKPLLKTQVDIDSLKKPDKSKNITHTENALDENGNSKTFETFPKVAKSIFGKKKVGGSKRPASHSYGRTVPKKPRLVRELLSLSQDECKEIRCKGFHPADVIRVVNGIQCQDSDKSFHSIPLNKSNSYYLSTKKLYSKLNVMAIDQNLSESNLFLSDTSETRSLQKDNIYRQLYLLDEAKYSSKVQELVNWNLKNRHNSAPPIRKENPRRTHRQLIRSQSGMCVLSYHLPRFR